MRVASIWSIWPALLAWSAARADSSVARPPAAEAGWCVARYLKQLDVAAPKAAPSEAKAGRFKLGTLSFELALPPRFASSSLEGDALQVSPGAATTTDNFGQWEATLQVRWQ